MCLSISKRVVLVLFAVAALLVIASTAAGQCSMCRTALTGSNNALFIRNFNIGVLVLLVPPVTIFCSIFVVLNRYRNSAGEVASDLRDDKRDSHL
ncbi:MAG TPA: hypothetical protein VEW46_16330 [Pyrinomonadaceae bacterium]|nr:hypothetical protein [Pyrinomonadaceae bacterium]